MSSSTLSRIVLPLSRAIPYSVTTQSDNVCGMVTFELSMGTIRDMFPPLAVAGRTIIERPFLER